MVWKKSKSIFFGLVFGALISFFVSLPYAFATGGALPNVGISKLCTPQDGNLNEVTITVINTGLVDLSNCQLVDPLAGLNISLDPILFGGSVVVQTSIEGLTQDTQNFATVTCVESTGTATATGSALCETEVLPPDMQMSKVCAAQVEGVNLITVTVTNTGPVDLYNCELTDAQADIPNVINLGTILQGQVKVEQLTLTGLLEDTINTVTVTCEDAPAGGAVITVLDNDLCEVPEGEGCLTRTPGFWGTHPHITDQYLPLESAGLTLDTTVPGIEVSATEDLCFSGRDFKSNDTSPQQLQLIRQCAAANLNVAATLVGGGDCEAEYPGLSALITSCCDELATSGANGNVISESSCIEDLDVFNNLGDTLDPFGPFISPGPADPRLCWEANGNGYINPGRNLGNAGAGGEGGKGPKNK